MSPPSGSPDTVEAHEAAAAAGMLGAAGEPSDKRAYVRRIFSEIAPRYDLLNHVLSLNIDRAWRRKAVEALDWKRAPSGTYVDLCAGTLDISLKLASSPGFHGLVLASDFAEPMLRVALPKVQRRAVSPVTADALSLPLQSATMDGAIVAFGARNLADLDAGIAEVFRVLRPGGRFVILEFTTPRNALIRGAYHAYFHHVLPVIGRAISGHRTAYRYLPKSVSFFPSVEELAARLTRVGFVDVEWRTLTFGIAAIHVAEKPIPDPLSPIP
ncbi:MAG: ubiquinone/menaquinone biosynthesis methyltransferase [Gemmatimonadaceae bacterium]